MDQARKQSTEFGKYRHENGNELSETFYVYAVTQDGGMIVIPFRSTKIKVYKLWNSQLRLFRVTDAEGRKILPPLFAHKVRVASVGQENAKGKFYNFTMAPAKGNWVDSLLRPDDPLFRAAMELNKMVQEGRAKAAFETEGQGDEETTPF